MLHPGKNVLAAAVWNFGVLTPLAQISDRTGFVLHGASDAERLADTNDSWEVEEEKGIGLLPTPPTVARKYYVSEPASELTETCSTGIGRMAPAEIWKKAKALEGASILGGAMQNDNWQLVPDPLPAMQMELSPAGHVVRSMGIDPPYGFPDKAFSVPLTPKLKF